MVRKVNGASVASLRKALGIPQVSLAARAGITPPFLSQIEHGARQPSPTVLRLLADGLGVPLDAISHVVVVPQPEETAS
jgi:transcriptional regulator with XRE-family HTH domain